MDCIVPRCKRTAKLMGTIHGFYNKKLYYCREHEEIFERVNREFEKIKEARKNGKRYKLKGIYRT